MKRSRNLSFALAAAAIASAASAAAQQPFVGEIRTVAFGFCPIGWLEADGALLPIAQYETLFFLYGTTFGGDGQTTYALPDLRGRATVGTGTTVLGEQGGAETSAIGPNQMPAHSHPVPGAGAPPSADVPTAAKGPVVSVRSSAPGPGVNSSAAGGNQPHENRQPFLTLLSCVATEGIFPSQN